MAASQPCPDVVESGAGPGRLPPRLRPVLVGILVAAVVGWGLYAQVARAQHAVARDTAATAAAATVRATLSGYDRHHVDVALGNGSAVDLRVRGVSLSYGSRGDVPGTPLTGRRAVAGFALPGGGSTTVRFTVSSSMACWAPSGRTPVLRLQFRLPGGSVRTSTVRIARPAHTGTDTAWRTALGSFECQFDAPRP